MAEITSPTSNPNRHLREYLAHYVGFAHPPKYAVMLSGRWGVGKTFHVKKVLDDLLAKTQKRHVLVSLYGLKSVQEIDDALFSALYPWTDNDGMRIAAAVGKALLKHAKLDPPNLKSSDLVNKMSADVFVFDDLERCRMPVTDVLGYINQLVERDGCKVIILANEEEIAEPEAYAKGKEKLIGKTLGVESDFDAAFLSFINTTQNPESKGIFEKRQSDIRDVHEQSSFQNLRILQQTMWDFERLYAAIDSKHRSNEAAMRDLLRLFFVLSFEFKAGCISQSDLESRTNRGLDFAFSKDKERSALTRASEKYPGLYVHDSILSDAVTTDILVHGIVEPDAVASSLDASAWFVSKSEPSWRTVWHSSERSDVDVRSAASRMQEEFAARKYEKTGELLHLFGQMLFLADLGATGRDRSETVMDCKAYIADLREQKRLEPLPEAFYDDIRHGSFSGLGFAQAETIEFRELSAFVRAQRAEAEIDQFEVEASSLLEMMREEPSEFVKQTTNGHAGSGRFANRPVLAAADPAKFADELIQLEPLQYREVLLGLSFRYDMARLSDGRELANERSWAISLERLVKERAETLECFARNRITKVLSWTLGEKLEELSVAEESSSVSEPITD